MKKKQIVPTGKMVLARMPMVHEVVGRFIRRLPPNVLREDIEAAATFGLFDALRKNGGDGGKGFEWYARTRIRGAILDELRREDWLSRRARWIAEGKRQPSARNTTPVTNVVGFDDLGARDRPTQFANETMSDAEDVMDESRERTHLRGLVDTLPERERAIVALYFFQGMQQDEIADLFEISTPRISQLLSRAVDRLRALADGASKTTAKQKHDWVVTRARAEMRPMRPLMPAIWQSRVREIRPKVIAPPISLLVRQLQVQMASVATKARGLEAKLAWLEVALHSPDETVRVTAGRAMGRIQGALETAHAALAQFTTMIASRAL